MPGRIVQDQELTHSFLFRHCFCHFIEEKLEDICIDSIDDQTEEPASLRSHCPNDILADVISQIRNRSAFARLNPSTARARIAFDAAFITKPEFHFRISDPLLEIFQESFSFLLILALRPGLRHAQMEIQFMQPAHGGAVAQLDLELFFQVSMEFHTGPMHLAGLSGIFQDRDQQIAHSFEFYFAWPARLRPRDQGIDPAAIEQFDPEPNHSIAATKLEADCGSGNVQQERADHVQTNVGTHVGGRIHRHAQFFERGVFRVWMKLR